MNLIMDMIYCFIRLLLIWFCLRVSLFAQIETPPFSGTAFLDEDIITADDPTFFQAIQYVDTQNRLVFDRRQNGWLNQEVYLFSASFSDGLLSEVRVNPEFGSIEQAKNEAVIYSTALGRLPTFLRKDMASVTIHDGVNPFGGGNNNVLIHTGQAKQYAGFLEEVLMHEAAHTSLDATHSTAADWLQAQEDDDAFISDWARDFPAREDIAESFLPWFAVRHRIDRIDQSVVDVIQSTIPNRLDYFDNAEFMVNEPRAIGDFDGNGSLDIHDLNTLVTQMQSTQADREFDLNFDGAVNVVDLSSWIIDLKQTWIGDANLNGVFDTSDMTQVFQSNRFELDVRADWSEGDWNGDLRFNSSDLIAAFQDGGYELGPRKKIRSVPEVVGPLSVVWIGVLILRRNSLS